MSISIHPFVRLINLLASVGGIVICKNNIHLFLFWIVFLFPLVVLTNNTKTHFKFLGVVVLPMCLMFVVLYFTMDSNLQRIIMTLLKFITCTTIVQVTFIIPLTEIYTTFKKWGIKGDLLITFLGSYIVWVDIINRSNNILTARFSRGFIKKRSMFIMLKQLPYLITPLIIGVIRTAIERSESWDQKMLIYKVENMKSRKIDYNFHLNFTITLVAGIWLINNIYLVLI